MQEDTKNNNTELVHQEISTEFLAINSPSTSSPVSQKSEEDTSKATVSSHLFNVIRSIKERLTGFAESVFEAKEDQVSYVQPVLEDVEQLNHISRMTYSEISTLREKCETLEAENSALRQQQTMSTSTSTSAESTARDSGHERQVEDLRALLNLYRENNRFLLRELSTTHKQYSWSVWRNNASKYIKLQKFVAIRNRRRAKYLCSVRWARYLQFRSRRNAHFDQQGILDSPQTPQEEPSPDSQTSLEPPNQEELLEFEPLSGTQEWTNAVEMDLLDELLREDPLSLPSPTHSPPLASPVSPTPMSRSNSLQGRPRRLLSEKRLGKRLIELKMKEVPVSDDGNCLFYAIAVQLFDDPDRHAEVRRETVQWLRKNSDFLIDRAVPLQSMEDMQGKTWNQYCHEMSTDKTFGTNSCLYAVSEIFGVPIFMVSSTEGSEYVLQYCPAEVKKEMILRLSFNDNNKHFNIIEYEPDMNTNLTIEDTAAWHCTACTRENYEDEDTCYSCDTPRISKPGNWRCDECTALNDADALACATCNKSDLVLDDASWVCARCNGLNNGATCSKCGDKIPSTKSI